MLEFKEAYKGQLGDIGKSTAFVHGVAKISSKIVLTDPVQVCVRLEQTEYDRMIEFCKNKSLRPISAMGMILQAAVKDFIDYDKSLEDVGKACPKEMELTEEEEKELVEESIKAHEEDLAKEKEAKAKGKKSKKVSVNMKE